MKRLVRVALLPVLFLVGCGSAAQTGVDSPRTETRQAVAFLERVDRAAKSYGRHELGHFLKLDEQALTGEDLKIPSTTSLAVKPSHTTYCIEVKQGSLPRDSRWFEATVASGFEGISAGDSCRS